jgi:hypothetical protein
MAKSTGKPAKAPITPASQTLYCNRSPQAVCRRNVKLAADLVVPISVTLAP